jgi:proteasome lid subunit RPN8/RPN11
VLDVFIIPFKGRGIHLVSNLRLSIRVGIKVGKAMNTLRLPQAQLNQIISHARESAPRECCGLIGGAEGNAQTIYPMRNAAADPLITYEAAPEDLFAAQRVMRERGEQLLAIYHSHPRSDDPKPSDTDVRLAYYPSAVYFIVGLGGEQPSLGAFRISERAGSWEPVEYEIAADASR